MVLKQIFGGHYLVIWVFVQIGKTQIIDISRRIAISMYYSGPKKSENLLKGSIGF